MSDRKPKTPPTPEEKLERKIRRLEGKILQLEASAKFAAEHRQQEAKSLQQDLVEHRRFIIDQLRKPFPALIHEYCRDRRHIDWIKAHPHSTVPHPEANHDLVDLMVEAASPHAFRDYERNLRARCPLCDGEPMGPYSTGGYAVPTGLERHLTGWGNAHKCFVMKVAAAEALQDARWATETPGISQMRTKQEPEVGGKAEAEEATAEISTHVRPCAAQRDLPEEQVTVWEIDSGGTLDGPYQRVLSTHPATRWVRGTRIQAGYARERWTTALRWRALPEGTRLWVALDRESSILLLMPLLNFAEEAAPPLPTWDAKAEVWRGLEPVLVDMIEGFHSYEWERRKRGEASE